MQDLPRCCDAGTVSSTAAVRPRDTPAAWAASLARIASGSRSTLAGAGETPPGTSRLPGRRIGRPDSLNWSAGASATCSAASQPASISDVVQVLSSSPAVSQLDRRVRKIGVSSSVASGIGLRESSRS